MKACWSTRRLICASTCSALKPLAPRLDIAPVAALLQAQDEEGDHRGHDQDPAVNGDDELPPPREREDHLTRRDDWSVVVHEDRLVQKAGTMGGTGMLF